MRFPAHYITRLPYTFALDGVGKILFWLQHSVNLTHECISSKLFKLLEIQIIFSEIFRVADLTHLQQSRWN